MNQPKISVIIPVYNVERYVEKCLKSILNQTMQEGVEIIIINDHTPDNSMEVIHNIVNEYNVKNGSEKMTIRIVNHTTNRGLAAVRNTGLSLAQGIYIIHIDSDDWIEPNMLEALYNKAEEENADMVMCDFWCTYKNHEELIQQNFTTKKEFLGRVLGGRSIALWNKLIRREIYTFNDIKNEEGYDQGEDYMTMMYLVYFSQKISYIPQPFYHYLKINPTSICNTPMNDKKRRSYLRQIQVASEFIQTYKLDEYKEILAKISLSTKCLLLATTRGKEQKYYSSLYPEASFYLSTYLKNCSLGHRLLLNNHFCIYNFIKYIKNLILKIKA